MRPLGILGAVLALLVLAAVAVGAYQYGLHDGLSQQIQNLPANTVPAPGYGYGYPYWYGPHFGFGFPFFGIFGFLFLLLILFWIFRPRRWYGGWGGPGYGPHGPGDREARLHEWHRRAHEAESGGTQGSPPKQ